MGLIRRGSNVAALFLIIVIVASGITLYRLRSMQPELETTPENIVDFRTVELRIDTDKEEYVVGDTISFNIYVYNPTQDTVWIKPIAGYTVEANSLYDPEPQNIAVSLSYPPDSYIKIEAQNKYTLHSNELKLSYPGPFTISCIGLKKTVNVTGARWEPLGTDHFYIKLEAITNRVQIGLVESILVLYVNEHPYDVKISHPVRAEYWFEPPEEHYGGTVDWELIDPTLTISANSTEKIYQIDAVGVDNCMVYWRSNNQTAQLWLWVEG